MVHLEVAAVPECPTGGFLMRTEASGLCSGELMSWYMDQKVPHVLGHEVAGIVVESDTPEFPVGCRVAPHHHAPCGHCEICQSGHHVHCPTWKATRLDPGGLAEYIAVEARLLVDCTRADDLNPRDAALIEPLACVMKGRRRARWTPSDRTAVIGLGVMGLLHMLSCPGAVGFELRKDRADWAKNLGMTVSESGEFDVIFVCPGSVAAMQRAVELAAPGARIVAFAPFGPTETALPRFNDLYFRDLELISSYSCGPTDTAEAAQLLRTGQVRADQVVSHEISFDDLPSHYIKMRDEEILKPMVIFP